MKKHQIDFIYGQFSSGNKKYNFKDIYNDPVGLTGSETSCISFAKEMANRGYYTTIFIESIDSIPPQYIWNNLHIQRLHYFRVARKPPEIVYAWNEPDQLMFAPEKALRMVNQQLNDFGYVQNRDYDTITDIYTSPSQSHLDYLSQSTPNKAKWRVLDNGFDPAMFYPREKRPYSVIYASSPDRGLHLLLEAWPQIKKEVPKATLDIFYDCTQFLENEITKNPGENIALKEYVNRGKYILYALDKLKNGYDIKHHKGISKNKIAEEMGRAKVLGYPCSTISFTEGFSATIVEACASGIVPVISRQDSLGQIYGEALKDTIIDTPTRQHMDKFIEMVVKGLTDDKFAKETTERAMEFAKNYTWEKLGDKLEKIIEEGLEMKR